MLAYNQVLWLKENLAERLGELNVLRITAVGQLQTSITGNDDSCQLRFFCCSARCRRVQRNTQLW